MCFTFRTPDPLILTSLSAGSRVTAKPPPPPSVFTGEMLPFSNPSSALQDAIRKLETDEW